MGHKALLRRGRNRKWMQYVALGAATLAAAITVSAAIVSL
jgi:hypothetical protein